MGYDSTRFVGVTVEFSGGVIVTSKAWFCLVCSLDSSFPILESEYIHPDVWYVLVQQGEYFNFALEISQIFPSTFLRPF
jgi:hypothetical protein